MATVTPDRLLTFSAKMANYNDAFYLLEVLVEAVFLAMVSGPKNYSSANWFVSLPASFSSVYFDHISSSLFEVNGLF